VVLEAAGLGSWDWDLRTGTMVWDARSAEIFGLTGQDLDGTVADAERTIHPHDLPVVREAMSAVVARSGRLDVDYRVVRPEGVRWVSSLGRVISDDAGRPVRMVGTHADVTDAREAAREQFADADRKAGLLSVAQHLGGTVTRDDAVDVVARHAAQVLGTTGVILCLVEGDAVTSITAAPLADDVRNQVARLPRDHPLPMVRSAVTGTAFFVPDLDTAVRLFPGGAGIWARSGTRAGCSVPLRTPTGLLGSLSLGQRTDREWRPADREYVQALAALTAQTLERIASVEAAAAAARAVARLAETLQRSLLTAPPEPDHLHVVTRYLPAAAEAQVGGDWYDAFLGPDGATHLVIGDVTGHDREAAATMGALRNLLRGIAWAGGGTPAQVLATLDRAVLGLAVGALATVLTARVEQPGGEGSGRLLRWSNAGHPPPLLVDPGGRVRLLDQRDLMLGVDPTRPRHDHTVELAPGATLLLYTDGVVERRGEDLDQGIARLVSVVGRLVQGGVPLDELCDRVLSTLPAHPDDDIALLALRAHPEDVPRPREAGPNAVPELPAAPG
jgi:PAS domain S-box-containing protein